MRTRALVVVGLLGTVALLGGAGCSSNSDEQIVPPPSDSSALDTGGSDASGEAPPTDAPPGDGTADGGGDSTVSDSGSDAVPEAAFDAAADAGKGTLPVCAVCTTDAECAPGEVCVDLGLGAAYRFCALTKAAAPGGDCSGLRLYHTAEAAPTVSSGTVTVCLARADCASIRNFKKSCPAPPGGCGLGGAGTTWDCWSKGGAVPLCTLVCVVELDCPTGSSCLPYTSGGTTYYRCMW